MPHVTRRAADPVRLAGQVALHRVHGPKAGLTRTILVATDAAALIVATAFVSAASSLFGDAVWTVTAAWMWPLPTLCMLGFVLVGLYPGVGLGPVEELRRVALVVAGLHVLTLLVFVYVGVDSIGWYVALVASWIVVTGSVLAGRAALRSLVARRRWWGVPVVVLGSGPMADGLIRSVEQNPGLDLKVIGFFDDEVHEDRAGVPWLGTLDDIDGVAKRFRFKRALITISDLTGETLGRLLDRHAAVLHEAFVVPGPFGPPVLGLAAHGLGGKLVLRSPHHLAFRINRWAKRGLDLTLLLPLVLVSAPVLLLGVLAVMLSSRGTPFYAQPREGYRGRVFNVWKLRTMYPGADALLVRHLAENPDARDEWQSTFKLRNDPRVVPVVGHLLRRTSIDELPQLWNVLKGEMSLVGPRPFPQYHLAQFSPEFRALRQSVLPGVTGLWQVSVRSDGDLEVQEQLDAYYIRNWSMWFDLYLLMRTPFAVLFSRGAY